MFLEFTAPFGAWKSGDISSDVPEGVARSLVTQGIAKEIDGMAYLRASQQTEFNRFRDDMLGQIRTAMATKPAPKGPPSVPTKADGTGLELTRIDASESSEERGPKRGLADVLRCIALQGGIGVPPEQQHWASNRIRNVYAEEVCHYTVEEDTGAITSTRTRSMADGGMETITRTGTDSVSGGTTYGFAVKPEYLGSLFEIAMEQGVFAPAAMSIPVGQGVEVKWPALDQYQAPTSLNGIPQAAVFAGITLAYKGEATQRTSSDANLNMIDFKVHDLTGFTALSRDFISDNFLSMESQVQRLFGRAMGWIEDWVTMRGTGSSCPQGFFNSSALIASGPSSGHRYAANKIASEDLFWMMSKMATMCWPGARWVANITTIPQLAILTNAAGAAVFQPNALIAQGDVSAFRKGSTFERAEMMSKPMGMLIGFPIYFTEKVPILGATGDISLVCPDQYGIARRAGIEFGLSEHFYFDTDRVAFRFKLRHDGKSLWRAPYTQADGSSTTVSPFVQLVTTT